MMTPAFSQPAPKVYTPVSRPHSWKEVAFDYSFMYGVLWVSFLASQPSHIDNLSFDNFNHNVFEIGAIVDDKNRWTTNYVGHPLAGSEFYLYFRSRGYAPKWAFLHMALTSAMFEIAVESFHKPPSTIDLVVTPALGWPLGWWRETQGLKMVNSDTKYKRVIGHILYLETNFWFFEETHLRPAINIEQGFTGFNLYARF